MNNRPCNTCPKQITHCSGPCPEWENWFRMKWRALRKLYLGIDDGEDLYG